MHPEGKSRGQKLPFPLRWMTPTGLVQYSQVALYCLYSEMGISVNDQHHFTVCDKMVQKHSETTTHPPALACYCQHGEVMPINYCNAPINGFETAT